MPQSLNDSLSETFYRSKASMSVMVSEYIKRGNVDINQSVRNDQQKPTAELRLRISWAHVVNGTKKIDKDSLQAMVFDTHDIFNIIIQIRNLLNGQAQKIDSIVHSSNTRMTSLEVKKGKEYGYVLTMNVNDTTVSLKDSFLISFSPAELHYLMFLFSKILSYITTGTLMGYSVNWI